VRTRDCRPRRVDHNIGILPLTGLEGTLLLVRAEICTGQPGLAEGRGNMKLHPTRLRQPFRPTAVTSICLRQACIAGAEMTCRSAVRDRACFCLLEALKECKTRQRQRRSPTWLPPSPRSRLSTNTFLGLAHLGQLPHFCVSLNAACAEFRHIRPSARHPIPASSGAVAEAVSDSNAYCIHCDTQASRGPGQRCDSKRASTQSEINPPISGLMLTCSGSVW
jgi:hypothetical protein